jgi:hypothetical protein
MSDACVRVSGGGCSDSVAIIFSRSTSLPDRIEGQPYRCRLGDNPAQLREKISRDTVVAEGSWNLDEGELGAVLRRWRCIPDVKTVWPRDASARVCGTCRRGSCRVIDHFEACTPSWELLFPYYLFVDYSWVTSDHFPVFASVLRLVGALLEHPPSP